MRTLLVAFVLMCGFASSTLAAPFTPDRIQLITGSPFFDDTGTNTLCIRCDDPDPFNDVMASLLSFGSSFGFWPPPPDPLHLPAFLSIGGIIDTRGSTAPSLDGLFGTFHIPVEMRLWNSLEPTLVSVTPGFLFGTVFPSEFECCFGVLNTVVITPTGSLRDPYFGGFGVVGVLEAPRPVNPAFTPIPEPSTLLLIGSGIAATLSQRRRLT